MEQLVMKAKSGDAANPSLASEIPVLGSIFNKMQGIFGTSDDTSLSRYQTTDLNIINCCS